MNKKTIFKQIILRLVIPYVLWVILTWGIYFLWAVKLDVFMLYVSLPILIMAFVLSVFIHELGHAMTFIMLGYRLKAFMILGLVMKSHPFKITTDRYLLQMLGGIVIPELKDTSNDVSFNQHKQSLRYALLSGPIYSYLYVIMLVVSFIITKQPIIYFLMMNTLFITYIMHKSFFIKHDHMYGDYKAFQALKKDDLLLLLMYHQHMMLYPFNHDTKTFIYQKVYHVLQQKKEVSINQDRHLLMMLSDGFRLGYIGSLEDEVLDFHILDHTSSYRLIKDDMTLAYMVYLYWITKHYDRAHNMYQYMLKKEKLFADSLALCHTFVYDKTISNDVFKLYQEGLSLYQHILDKNTLLDYLNQSKNVSLLCRV